MFVRTVVGENNILTELLQIFVATSAIAAGIDHAADGSEIAFLEFFHVATNCNDAPNDLVTGHAGIRRSAPLIARGVNIGMANAAEEDVDLYVVRQWIASHNRMRRERRFSRMSCVSLGLRSHTIDSQPTALLRAANY